ncbi:MAG: CHC2 zinc finger domain-containing protein [Patescibacteria group bacterium]
MNSAVEDIKSRINIVDLIGEYVRVQKAGASWKALCPFHREKSPSFMINEEKQIWHCFGCNKGGDVFGFLMEIEGIEFKEAMKILAEKTGVELPKFSKNQIVLADSRKKILEILELAMKFYEKQLWDGAGKEKILSYLRERGLTDNSIREFRLGYAPNGWRNLLDFLIKRGYSIEEINKTGLLVNKSVNNEQESVNNNLNNKDTGHWSLVAGHCYDRFRDRIIFPIMDVMNNVVGFSARVAPGGDETQAKYVNTPETEVYHKSKVLYGINRAKQEIKGKNSVIIVEGNMDVIAAHQAGVKNTVAVSGTALTPDQVDTLKRYANKFKMLFDMDNAGEKATERSAEVCFQKDVNVSVITLSGGKDVAEIVQKNPKEFIEAEESAVPIMDYFFGTFFRKYDKNKVEDKKIIASGLLSMIKNFGNAIEKSHWIKKLSEKIEVGENILLETLKKAEKRIKGGNNFEAVETRKNLKSRTEIIQEKIAGIMLNFPPAWKDISNDISKKEYLENNRQLFPIFEMAEGAQYKFENFISLINKKEEKDFFQNLYFETRYIREEEEFAENDFSDANDQIEYLLGELKKEENKNKLNVIFKDIKKAEENKDKEGKMLLINEFDKLSKENK